MVETGESITRTGERSVNSPKKVTRRRFLAATGAAAGALSSVAPAVLAGGSPNETIGVGCIGLGTRGGDLINEVVKCSGVRVVAVCDVYKPHLEKGVQRSQNPEVKTYVDYQDLLAETSSNACALGGSPNATRTRPSSKRPPS